MQQALVLSINTRGIRARPSRDRFNALAIRFAKKPPRIRRERLASQGVSENSANTGKVVLQPLLRSGVHRVLHGPEECVGVVRSPPLHGENAPESGCIPACVDSSGRLRRSGASLPREDE